MRLIIVTRSLRVAPGLGLSNRTHPATCLLYVMAELLSCATNWA
jgi:hypothetical protein